MPIVKILRSRGTNLVVVANAELLFKPTGPIANFNNSLSQRVRNATALAAPTNKRPRWMHYGKPLKKTMRASTDLQPNRLHAYFAVGSTAAYSAYVDQGTGVYGGNGPYGAKILPPWHRGSPSLYEHTWKVPRSAGINMRGERVVEWEELGRVTIKGQKGQFFFARGLKDAMVVSRASLGLPRNKGTNMTSMAKALSLIPDHLHNFRGNTPWSFAFDVQLREWRSWRDEAWYRRELLGEGYTQERLRRGYRDALRARAAAKRRRERQERSRATNAERQERWRRKQGAVTRDEYVRNQRRRRMETNAMNRERALIIRNYTKKYGDRFFPESLFLNSDGVWEYLLRGEGRRADIEIRYLQPRFNRTD